MLADIGITRSDLRDAYSDAPWRDPSELLARRAHRTPRSRPQVRADLRRAAPQTDGDVRLAAGHLLSAGQSSGALPDLVFRHWPILPSANCPDQRYPLPPRMLRPPPPGGRILFCCVTPLSANRARNGVPPSLTWAPRLRGARVLRSEGGSVGAIALQRSAGMGARHLRDDIGGADARRCTTGIRSPGRRLSALRGAVRRPGGLLRRAATATTGAAPGPLPIRTRRRAAARTPRPAGSRTRSRRRRRTSAACPA